ncbi:MAG: class I SAM-dependent methyltransferase, partial [Pseudomonadota bacterium]
MQDRLVHNDRDRKYHDVIAVEYEKLVNQPRSYMNSLLFEPLFNERFRRVGKVLDLGCGTGQMVFRLHERFQPESITAVDHSAGMLKSLENEAKQNGITVNTVHGELIDFINHAVDHYDLITCVGVLHHLKKEDVVTLLTRARELLAADGRLLVAEPIDNT